MAVKNKDLEYLHTTDDDELDDDEIEVSDAYELLGYKMYSRLQVCLAICSMIVCVAMIAGITFLSYKMNNHYFVWLYLIPMIIYAVA